MRSMKRSPWRASVCSMRRMSTRSLPMPRIMAGASSRPRLLPARHGGAHPLHRGPEPFEHGVADQEVPDVELDNLRNGADRLRGDVVEAVAGMHLEPEPRRLRGAGPDALEFGFRRRLVAV